MRRLLATALAVLLFVAPAWTALTFGAATSDRVNHGSAASLDNLAALTAMAWVYPTTLTSSRTIISKYRGSSSIGWRLALSGTGGDISLEWFRTGTDMNYITSDTPLAITNAWYFVAMTADSTVGHIYTGTLTTPVVESSYGASTAGSGSPDADGARSLFVGNVDATSPTLAFQGRIAWAAVWNRVLTREEIQAQQFKPFCKSSDGCVLFTHLGWAGTGTQPDLSGSSNNGTVTGATVSDHVPIARQP